MQIHLGTGTDPIQREKDREVDLRRMRAEEAQGLG